MRNVFTSTSSTYPSYCETLSIIPQVYRLPLLPLILNQSADWQGRCAFWCSLYRHISAKWKNIYTYIFFIRLSIGIWRDGQVNIVFILYARGSQWYKIHPTQAKPNVYHYIEVTLYCLTFSAGHIFRAHFSIGWLLSFHPYNLLTKMV